METIWQEHRWANQLQTWLLVALMLALGSFTGSLLFGPAGAWVALGASLLALLLEPAAAARLTLRLYHARPLGRSEAPQLWALLETLSTRAGLAAVPQPHLVPSAVTNAFAVGNRRHAAIALTDGLLRSLDWRELQGVLAHELAHIAHDDLRVMGLADYVSRLTGMFATAGQLGLLLSLPWLLAGQAAISWSALLLLILSPYLAVLVQLGLSRTREFDADLAAARLTGDPAGLARALTRIERASRAWQSWLMPGWGNPEPSWLRTHPETAERVRRLQELAATLPPFDGPDGAPLAPAWPRQQRRPRWHPGGYWH